MALSDGQQTLLDVLLGLEPEVPEKDRPGVAWNNLPGNPWDLFYKTDQDGRTIYFFEYGQNTNHGWHVHHRLDQALGGRHNASNLVARHWMGNTQAGGILNALLNKKPQPLKPW